MKAIYESYTVGSSTETGTKHTVARFLNKKNYNLIIFFVPNVRFDSINMNSLFAILRTMKSCKLNSIQISAREQKPIFYQRMTERK